MWEVEGAQGQGGMVYVVGSVSLGRAGPLSFLPVLEAASRRLGVLVVEES